MKMSSKLEVLYLTSLSILVWYLQVILMHTQVECLSEIPTMPANTRPAWKNLPGTNALACLAYFISDKGKKFERWTHVFNVKLSSASLMKRSNEPELLYLTSLSSIAWHLQVSLKPTQMERLSGDSLPLDLCGKAYQGKMVQLTWPLHQWQSLRIWTLWLKPFSSSPLKRPDKTS